MSIHTVREERLAPWGAADTREFTALPLPGAPRPAAWPRERLYAAPPASRAVQAPRPASRYFYGLSTRMYVWPGLGFYRAYALHIYRCQGLDWEEQEVIPDIGTDGERAAAFAARCTLEQVEPCHVRGMLEDWMGSMPV